MALFFILCAAGAVAGLLFGHILGVLYAFLAGMCVFAGIYADSFLSWMEETKAPKKS